jgi:PAS domain S-box-containing protein
MADTLRVLYVDDEPDLLEISRLFLEGYGQFSVKTLDSASSALELLQQEQFDAIVSDYQMPGMDGIQFLSEVRKQYGKIPFILFTGKGREEVVIQAINNGVDFYLQKGGEANAQFAELAHKIRLAVERYTVNTALQESEVRFRSLTQNSSDIIRIIDADGIIVFDSLSSRRILGYPPGFSIGKSPLEFIHPDDKKIVLNALTEVYNRTNPNIPTEFRIRKADGSYIPVETIASNLIGVPGINGIVTTTWPIEERKKSEDALKKSEGRFRGITERISDLVIISDPDGKPTYVSPSVQSILGFPPEYYLGESANPLVFPPGDVVKIGLATERLKKGSPEEQVEFRMKKHDGNFAVFEGRGIPVFEGSTYTGFQVIARDITKRKLAEDALRKSEERYRLLIDQTEAGVWIIDKEYQTTFVNKRLASMFGYTQQEMIGKQVREFMPVEELPVHSQRVRERLAGKTDRFEQKFFRKDGSELWAIASVTPFEEENNVTGAFAILTDITERKRAEEAHIISQKQLADAMDLAHIVNWEYDVASGLFTFDDRFYALYGTSAEIEGGNRMPAHVYAEKFVHPDDQYMVSNEVNKAINATDPGYVSQVEHRIIRRDGEIRNIVVRFGITKDENCRTIKTHGANQDITDRKRAEEALNQANKKLSLLSGITRHDINNQLAVLIGYLNILEKKLPDSALKEYFMKVSTAVRRISAMIQFTKEYEQIGVHAPAWQDCRTLVDTAAGDVTPGQVLVKNDLPAGTEVFADPLVVKVWYNLIDNAIRYGGKIRTIQFSLQESGDNHLIICEDDGEGIPTEDKEKIFERGFGKNTGMGLFLSREILSITGITITETGEPGKGARFEMKVPKGIFR